MAKDINLLPQTKLNILRQEVTIRIVRTIGIGVLLLVASCEIGIFFLNRTTSLAELQVQRNTLKSSLSLLHDKAITNILLLDRFRKIQALQKNQVSFVADITTIQSLVPDGVTIDTFALDQKTIILSVSSYSLVPVNTFLDRVNALYAQKELFKKVTIDNVSANASSGKYSVTVNGDLL